jgi:hypothetical protein
MSHHRTPQTYIRYFPLLPFVEKRLSSRLFRYNDSSVATSHPRMRRSFENLFMENVNVQDAHGC